MKRPLIQDIDRWISWKFPESFTAARVNLTIAKARFKRECQRAYIDPIYKFLSKYTNGTLR
jgi:hypothetical protein